MKLYNCVFTTNRVSFVITEKAASEYEAERQALNTLDDEFGISLNLNKYSVEIEEV